MDVPVEDLDFIRLEKLSKSDAHDEIETFVRIVPGHKCVVRTNDSVPAVQCICVATTSLIFAACMQDWRAFVRRAV